MYLESFRGYKLVKKGQFWDPVRYFQFALKSIYDFVDGPLRASTAGEKLLLKSSWKCEIANMYLPTGCSGCR